MHSINYGIYILSCILFTITLLGTILNIVNYKSVKFRQIPQILLSAWIVSLHCALLSYIVTWDIDPSSTTFRAFEILLIISATFPVFIATTRITRIVVQTEIKYYLNLDNFAQNHKAPAATNNNNGDANLRQSQRFAGNLHQSSNRIPPINPGPQQTELRSNTTTSYFAQNPINPDDLQQCMTTTDPMVANIDKYNAVRAQQQNEACDPALAQQTNHNQFRQQLDNSNQQRLPAHDNYFSDEIAQHGGFNGLFDQNGAVIDNRNNARFQDMLMMGQADPAMHGDGIILDGGEGASNDFVFVPGAGPNQRGTLTALPRVQSTNTLDNHEMGIELQPLGATSQPPLQRVQSNYEAQKGTLGTHGRFNSFSVYKFDTEQHQQRVPEPNCTRRISRTLFKYRKFSNTAFSFVFNLIMLCFFTGLIAIFTRVFSGSVAGQNITYLTAIAVGISLAIFNLCLLYYMRFRNHRIYLYQLLEYNGLYQAALDLIEQHEDELFEKNLAMQDSVDSSDDSEEDAVYQPIAGPVSVADTASHNQAEMLPKNSMPDHSNNNTRSDIAQMAIVVVDSDSDDERPPISPFNLQQPGITTQPNLIPNNSFTPKSQSGGNTFFAPTPSRTLSSSRHNHHHQSGLALKLDAPSDPHSVSDKAPDLSLSGRGHQHPASKNSGLHSGSNSAQSSNAPHILLPFHLPAGPAPSHGHTHSRAAGSSIALTRQSSALSTNFHSEHSSTHLNTTSDFHLYGDVVQTQDEINAQITLQDFNLNTQNTEAIYTGELFQRPAADFFKKTKTNQTVLVKPVEPPRDILTFFMKPGHCLYNESLFSSMGYLGMFGAAFILIQIAINSRDGATALPFLGTTDVLTRTAAVLIVFAHFVLIMMTAVMPFVRTYQFQREARLLTRSILEKYGFDPKLIERQLNTRLSSKVKGEDEKGQQLNLPSLKEIVTNYNTLTLFRTFLQGEFSEENLHFYQSVADFKTTLAIHPQVVKEAVHNFGVMHYQQHEKHELVAFLANYKEYMLAHYKFLVLSRQYDRLRIAQPHLQLPAPKPTFVYEDLFVQRFETIYYNFLHPGSKYEVNLPATLRASLLFKFQLLTYDYAAKFTRPIKNKSDLLEDHSFDEHDTKTGGKFDLAGTSADYMNPSKNPHLASQGNLSSPKALPRSLSGVGRETVNNINLAAPQLVDPPQTKQEDALLKQQLVLVVEQFINNSFVKAKAKSSQSSWFGGLFDAKGDKDGENGDVEAAATGKLAKAEKADLFANRGSDEPLSLGPTLSTALEQIEMAHAMQLYLTRGQTNNFVVCNHNHHLFNIDANLLLKSSDEVQPVAPSQPMTNAPAATSDTKAVLKKFDLYTNLVQKQVPWVGAITKVPQYYPLTSSGPKPNDAHSYSDIHVHSLPQFGSQSIPDHPISPTSASNNPRPSQLPPDYTLKLNMDKRTRNILFPKHLKLNETVFDLLNNKPSSKNLSASSSTTTTTPANPMMPKRTKTFLQNVGTIHRKIADQFRLAEFDAELGLYVVHSLPPPGPAENALLFSSKPEQSSDILNSSTPLPPPHSNPKRNPSKPRQAQNYPTMSLNMLELEAEAQVILTQQQQQKEIKESTGQPGFLSALASDASQLAFLELSKLRTFYFPSTSLAKHTTAPQHLPLGPNASVRDSSRLQSPQNLPPQNLSVGDASRLPQSSINILSPSNSPFSPLNIPEFTIDPGNPYTVDLLEPLARTLLQGMYLASFQLSSSVLAHVESTLLTSPQPQNHNQQRQSVVQGRDGRYSRALGPNGAPKPRGSVGPNSNPHQNPAAPTHTLSSQHPFGPGPVPPQLRPFLATLPPQQVAAQLNQLQPDQLMSTEWRIFALRRRLVEFCFKLDECVNLLDSVQNEVFSLMERDSYRRFLRSNTFIDFFGRFLLEKERFETQLADQTHLQQMLQCEARKRQLLAIAPNDGNGPDSDGNVEQKSPDHTVVDVRPAAVTLADRPSNSLSTRS